MQYSSLDDCSDTLRDAYGFSVPPLYADLHRSFASIWQTEEAERGERWKQWLQSFRDLDVVKSSQEDDAQLMERALAHYTAGAEEAAGGKAGSSKDDAADNNIGINTTPTASPINLEEAELLQQLRALVQMGIPINRRAQFWSVFLNINSKKQPGVYLSLVQAALDREAECKKAAALASYQTLTTFTSSSSGSDPFTFTPAGDSFQKCHKEGEEDYFCVTPLTASSSSNNSSTHSSPVTPFESTVPQIEPHSQQPQQDGNRLEGQVQEELEDWLPQIDKDLHRTFPDHPMMDTPGRAALRRILGAYSIRAPEVGYCQGLNFLAAAFMLLFNEEDAFWCLVVVIEDLLPGYFDLRMIAPQVDGQVLAHLLRGSAPRVAQHLDKLQVDIPSATSAWFLVAFLNSLPLETCLRVWDVFFFERSSVVLFRAALALIDIYSQALLETDDSSEAYLLLQALGPMSFDSSRLVDSACIGFGHVNDAALRVLRDKYRPQILEAMESMFTCDEELQNYFESAMNDAAQANSLSRSQSFTETFAAAAARSAAAASGGSCSDAASISCAVSIGSSHGGDTTNNSTPRSSAPHSPLSRYNSTFSTIIESSASASPTAAAAGTTNQQGRPYSPAMSPSPRRNSPGKQPSLKVSPLSPQHRMIHNNNGNNNSSSNTAVNTGVSTMHPNTFWTPPPSSHMKDHHHQQQQLRSTSPLLLLRRSRSAATLGGAVRRSHSSMHHYVHQRIDLHSLAAFVPDLSHPKVAALYRIAAKPSPRKKTLTAATAAAAAVADGSARSVGDGTNLETPNASTTDEKGKDNQRVALQWESALAQLPEEFKAAFLSSSGNGNGNPLFESGATIDIGGLAGLIKALKHGQNANQNLKSSQETGEEGAAMSENLILKKVLRRVTDGGALFGKNEIGQLIVRNFKLESTNTIPSLDDTMSSAILPSSPGSNAEKLEQLYRLRDDLAAEVAAAGRRQAAAMEASIIAVDTAEALHRQLAKIQGEIDVKMGSLLELYNRISSTDYAISVEEEEEQAELGALEEAQATLEELKDARAVQAAVVAALMSAVDGIRLGGGR